MAGLRAQKIAKEVTDKFEDYDSRMSEFLSNYNLWSDLFKVTRRHHHATNLVGIGNISGSASRGTASQPRVTEMFRAVNALATLMTRMMTSNDPYFEMKSMDLLGDNNTLDIIEETLQTQLRATQHKRYLLKANQSTVLFGTTIVEEPFEILGINNFGRKLPVTAFRPRSLLQVAFARNTTDIDRATWLSTSDISSKSELERMAKDQVGGDVWIMSAVAEVLAGDPTDPNLSDHVISRLTRAGYDTTDSAKDTVRLVTYHGKLDTMNDNIEYIAVVANYKHLVKFHPNNFQHGKRNFRVARWVEWELEPLALGLGQILAPLHRTIDANRQRLQDAVRFDTYGMWILDRLAGIDPNSFRARPNNIVVGDGTNGIKRLEPNPTGTRMGLELEQLLQQEFRAASGATDTLGNGDRRHGLRGLSCTE